MRPIDSDGEGSRGNRGPAVGVERRDRECVRVAPSEPERCLRAVGRCEQNTVEAVVSGQPDAERSACGPTPGQPDAVVDADPGEQDVVRSAARASIVTALPFTVDFTSPITGGVLSITTASLTRLADFPSPGGFDSASLATTFTS